MISVKDYRTAWTDRDTKAYEKAESLIDREIEADRSGRISADLSKAGDLTTRVRMRLEAAYRGGGWIVTWSNGDQRDPGPFFQLSAPESP